MTQSSSPRRGPLRRLLPLATAALLLAGCDSGGGGTQTAEFPKMEKPGPPPTPPKEGKGAVNRQGSEAGYPQ